MPSSAFGPVLYGLVPATAPQPEGIPEAIEYIAKQLRIAKDALAVRDPWEASKAADRAEHGLAFVRGVMGK